MASLPKFFVGDKVKHRDFELPGVVTKVGREVSFAGRARARAIWWTNGLDGKPPKPWAWTWDFELEAW